MPEWKLYSCIPSTNRSIQQGAPNLYQIWPWRADLAYPDRVNRHISCLRCCSNRPSKYGRPEKLPQLVCSIGHLLGPALPRSLTKPQYLNPRKDWQIEATQKLKVLVPLPSSLAPPSSPVPLYYPRPFPLRGRHSHPLSCVDSSILLLQLRQLAFPPDSCYRACRRWAQLLLNCSRTRAIRNWSFVASRWSMMRCWARGLWQSLTSFLIKIGEKDEKL